MEKKSSQDKNALLLNVLLLAMVAVCSTGCKSIKTEESPCELWREGSLKERGELALSFRRQGYFVGDPISAVISCLGEPAEEMDGCVMYLVDTGTNFVIDGVRSPITVYFELCSEEDGTVVMTMIRP